MAISAGYGLYLDVNMKSISIPVFRKFIAALVVVSLAFNNHLMARAQSAPGTSLVTAAILRGLALDVHDPFRLNFLFESAETADSSLPITIKYFLTALTVPEKDLWVNLSPGEAGRITSESLAKTDMGRDLLAQDLMLKRITAAFLSPEHEVGQKVWESLTPAEREGFSADVLQRIWIVPASASIVDRGTKVWINDARLTVKMEMADQGMGNGFNPQHPTTNPLEKFLLPAIETEINEGESFAPLRRMYHAMLTAAWYKSKLRESVMRSFIDQAKTGGLQSADPSAIDRIYH